MPLPSIQKGGQEECDNDNFSGTIKQPTGIEHKKCKQSDVGHGKKQKMSGQNDGQKKLGKGQLDTKKPKTSDKKEKIDTEEQSDKFTDAQNISHPVQSQLEGTETLQFSLDQVVNFLAKAQSGDLKDMSTKDIENMLSQEKARTVRQTEGSDKSTCGQRAAIADKNANASSPDRSDAQSVKKQMEHGISSSNPTSVFGPKPKQAQLAPVPSPKLLLSEEDSTKVEQLVQHGLTLKQIEQILIHGISMDDVQLYSTRTHYPRKLLSQGLTTPQIKHFMSNGISATELYYFCIQGVTPQELNICCPKVSVHNKLIN